MSLLDHLTDQDEERARTKRINGVVIALVTNNKDPDGLGRVKIKFPWLSDDNESDWVRIISFMAGKERGGVFLPEVDDEVLVAFEHGDIDHPFVIGALWNGKDKPPEKNSDGKNNIRKITSRSGHEIIFDDNNQQKKEKLEIHTKAGHKIVLDDAAGKEKIEIKDKTGSNKVIIDSVKNAINIESAMQLKIKSTKIDIEATGNLTIKGAIVNIEGSGPTTVKSSAILTLQGALVKIN
jgi:uncharacterized protein involved in type VI secretion and phage assembly